MCLFQNWSRRGSCDIFLSKFRGLWSSRGFICRFSYRIVNGCWVWFTQLLNIRIFLWFIDYLQNSNKQSNFVFTCRSFCMLHELYRKIFMNTVLYRIYIMYKLEKNSDMVVTFVLNRHNVRNKNYECQCALTNWGLNNYFMQEQFSFFYIRICRIYYLSAASGRHLKPSLNSFFIISKMPPFFIILVCSTIQEGACQRQSNPFSPHSLQLIEGHTSLITLKVPNTEILKFLSMKQHIFMYESSSREFKICTQPPGNIHSALTLIIAFERQVFSVFHISESSWHCSSWWFAFGWHMRVGKIHKIQVNVFINT